MGAFINYMPPTFVDKPAIGLMEDWLSTIASAVEADRVFTQELIEAFEDVPIGIPCAELIPWLLPQLFVMLNDLADQQGLELVTFDT